jgi:hypothetical protein
MNGAATAGIDRFVVFVAFAQIASKQADGLFEVVDVVRA